MLESTARHARRLALAVLLACTPVVALANPYTEVASAFQRGDYKTTLALLTPLAQAGDPFAQFLIGDHYQYGRGVGLNPRGRRRGFVRPLNKAMMNRSSVLELNTLRVMEFRRTPEKLFHGSAKRLSKGMLVRSSTSG